MMRTASCGRSEIPERSGRPVVASGTAIASADRGYAVHVEATGLKPATRYAYRFTLGDFSSEGQTLTAPAAGTTPDKVRFAFCSCAEYEFAFPHAYELMARDEPDFIVHLGDYIYEADIRSILSLRRARPGPPSRL